MSLVTVARYGAITGDTTTADTVSARLEEAQWMLEDELARPLESAERIEPVWPDRGGWLWPLATPITAAEGWTIRGHGITGGAYPTSWCGYDDPVSLTYTGGYVERTANPDATNRLPACIERDIAWAAYALANADTLASQIPAGASAVSVGDISVSFDGNASSRSGDDMTVKWSRRTLRYRRRNA